MKQPSTIRCSLYALVALLIQFGNSLAQQIPSRSGVFPGERDILALPPERFTSSHFQFQAGHPDQFRVDDSNLNLVEPATAVAASNGMPADIKALMKPTYTFGSEWITGSDFDLSSYEFKITVPTYPFFGPPPPMVSLGVGYTNLADARSFDLPADLYTYSVGLAWVRILNDRWKLRTMAGIALATDNQNTGSEAWQFRGGLFAVYEPNERWQWVFGGLALGRRDLPFVPAIGAIWQPSPMMKYDFTFPRPRFSMLINESDARQQWTYLGMELNGGTWAYETSAQSDELLTYGDWRVVIGWESVPAAPLGSMFVPGRKLGFEFGYVFARDLQRSENLPEIDLSNGVVFGIDARF